MKQKRAKTKKTGRNMFIVASAALAIVIAFVLLLPQSSPASSSSPNTQNPPSTPSANFGILSQATTDVCVYGYDQSVAFLDGSSSAYIQGACCNPMVFSDYVRQINGLKSYSNISEIPPDPYNMSVSLVKQMFPYANTTLNSNQNATFTQTLKLSKEGLCCCQCWAWYFHEGLMKYLILKYNLGATSLSNILDLEDCCGTGSGMMPPPRDD